jgi:hypothetical protein
LLNGIREKSTSAQYMLLLLTRKSGGNFHPQRRLNIVYWSVVDVLRDIYLFIVLRFQTSYDNCIKEAGTPQQLNTNYSAPFTKYQYKYRKQK